MARGRTATTLVGRPDGFGGWRRSPDELAVEEAMEIRLDGHLVTTTMRTPGHDFELAAGFCFSDGLLVGAPVTGVRYCATGSAVDTGFNVVTVDTAGRAPTPEPRLTTTTSACGLCGASGLLELSSRLGPLVGTESLPYSAFTTVADRIGAEQAVFALTGGVHAAAAFDASGTPLVVREDVGRHNAVDKVVGRLLLDGRLPASTLGLFVSGRASFELVQKAWAAGFSALVAVSAPSSLAVEAARSAGLTLAGFVRGDQLNLYAPERPGVDAVGLG